MFNYQIIENIKKNDNVDLYIKYVIICVMQVNLIIFSWDN